MPFVDLTSDGISIRCFLVDHDWSAKFAVTHYYPADITKGLTDRQSRRPLAEAMLLSVGINIFAEADEAQALRQSFATLGGGWVGVPLLCDQFLGSDKLVAGQRVYTQAQRLIDLTAPAIVASTAALTASHVYAPLVVGHLTTLPPLKPLSGTLALCAATLTEDSPWAFRVAVDAVDTALWPDTLEPDWSQPPTETPVQGVTFDQIGLQRERVIDDLERAFHWSGEAGFTLTDKTEIATLIGFFQSCRGPWTSFSAPAWFTPGTPTAEAPHESTYRFDDDVLRIDFETSTIASARIKFTQAPWEIVGVDGEAPQQPARIFLYRITHGLPSPQVWRFTNCWRPLTRPADGTYQPGPFLHDEISGGVDLSTEKTVLTSFLFPGNPLAMFNPLTLEMRLSLEIFEIESEPIDPSAAVLRWVGKIKSAPEEGRKFKAECVWLGGLLEQEFPRPRDGVGCQTQLFSSRCGHLKSAFLKSGTLTTAADSLLTVATAAADAADTFRGGWVEVGTGATWELRSIVASTPVADGQRLTIDAPIRQAAAAQAVAFYRGCDLAEATCQLLDPSGWKARFHGFPRKPVVNLTLPTLSQDSATKK
jgi:hypothetical protein